MNNLLEIENLSVKIKDRIHGDFFAVKNISLSLSEGSVLGIVGESGSGKSVTALAVMGLNSKDSFIDSGKINFNGSNLFNLSSKELLNIRGKDISMIFQDPMTGLNPLMKIGSQVEESLLLHSSLNKAERKNAALETMAYTGLKNVENLYNAYPHQLSGGMRQRVMIASAIAARPKLIIADEPTTALDSTTQTQILNLFKRMKEENNTSIIFISHNFGVINYISDFIAVMYRGHLMEYGKREEIILSPMHPYTKALIKCIPAADKKGKPLLSIKNDSGAAFDENACPFSGRCDYFKPSCATAYKGKYIGERFVGCVQAGELNE
ncbi:ABC transporter ATP-binding protein [Tyzzerella sp. OttesenSCG-928-J15]|nr:ABC transporter ATP-binding protein [Tyzzerella sp. OttesenSCG-928-J15]